MQVAASICRIALSDVDSRACSRPFDIVFKWSHDGGCPDDDPAEDQIADEIAEDPAEDPAELPRQESAEAADAADVREAARRLDDQRTRPPDPPYPPPPAPPYLVGVVATVAVFEGGPDAVTISDALMNADECAPRSSRDRPEIARRGRRRDRTPRSQPRLHAERGAARAVAWRTTSRSGRP